MQALRDYTIRLIMFQNGHGMKLSPTTPPDDRASASTIDDHDPTTTSPSEHHERLNMDLCW